MHIPLTCLCPRCSLVIVLVGEGSVVTRNNLFIGSELRLFFLRDLRSFLSLVSPSSPSCGGVCPGSGVAKRCRKQVSSVKRYDF